MNLAPGATIGRYQILEPLGQGGMATVYKAFQPALDRVVALKVMRADLAAAPEFVARFRREAKAIARLRHPHIGAPIIVAYIAVLAMATTRARESSRRPRPTGS